MSRRLRVLEATLVVGRGTELFDLVEECAACGF